jgi:hypothetical protein
MSNTLSFGGQDIELPQETDIQQLKNSIVRLGGPNGGDGWLLVDGVHGTYHLHVPSGGPIWIREAFE